MSVWGSCCLIVYENQMFISSDASFLSADPVLAVLFISFVCSKNSLRGQETVGRIVFLFLLWFVSFICHAIIFIYSSWILESLMSFCFLSSMVVVCLLKCHTFVPFQNKCGKDDAWVLLFLNIRQNESLKLICEVNHVRNN